jgi:acetate kinase
VLACAGDVPTIETLAAADLLRQWLPELRVRVVNVVDLMTLQPASEHPHGLEDAAYDALFPPRVPTIFAFHGYPWLIHRLTYRRAHHPMLHVRGYKEEGTTTTPFDMVVRNDLDRFHLVLDVIARVPGLADQAGPLAAEMRGRRKRHAQYIVQHGEDMPEVRELALGHGPMKVLVLNCGSSSLKFQVIATDADAIEQDKDERLARGVIERIGSEAILTFEARAVRPRKLAEPWRDHRAALDRVLRWLVEGNATSRSSGLSEIEASAIASCTAGEALKKSCASTTRSSPRSRRTSTRAAPQPRRTCAASRPRAAAFRARPPAGRGVRHRVPRDDARDRVPLRRAVLVLRAASRPALTASTGPHRYVAYRWRRLTGRSKEETKLITIHLGNGCSACAIVGGRSIDTSMGMTPLEGLVMGTRAGDIDPGLFQYLAHKEGLSPDEFDAMLNKQAGLLGVSGLTHDMRDLLSEAAEHGDRRAHLAIDLFVGRVRKYIGAYLAEMNGAEGIVFMGGIGENSAPFARGSARTSTRSESCSTRAQERRWSTAAKATSPRRIEACACG